MFDFQVHNKSSRTQARTGTFTTPHGDIKTPVFMPVGTKASVKTLSNEDLQELGAQITLANTYHLVIRPGDKLVKEMGGLHKWTGMNHPILTDSGGFQVFSLGKTLGVKIDDNGVTFKSHLDGKAHRFTPESAMEIQHNLGADIIMAFDECAPADSTKTYFEKAMKRTHDWLIRCKAHHHKLLQQNKEQRALFGIVQGGMYKDLREQSAEFVNSQDFPGNAIGGLSVGETKEQMYEMLDYTTPLLDENKPRYLMGVGTPEDILEAVSRGVDMFDCVHPTRLARHGGFFTLDGKCNIKNSKYTTDQSTLYGGYSKSYIRHLFMEKEILALRILTMHNLHFLLDLMQKIRQSIEEDNFQNFKTTFLKKYLS